MAAREHEVQAIGLRREGFTYEAIGKVLGVSTVSAFRIVRRVLRRWHETTGEEVTELRKLQDVRLDQLYRKAFAKVDNEDPGTALQAVLACLKIEKQRADLFGTNAPKKVNLTEDELDREIEEALRQMAEKKNGK